MKETAYDPNGAANQETLPQSSFPSLKSLMVILACLAVTSCSSNSPAVVTQYGPNHLTYSGSGERFEAACRKVLQEIGYSEGISENGVRYPYFGEGASTQKQEDRSLVIDKYLENKDEEGNSYRVTTLKLGDREPVVTLECTAADKYKLANALLAELHRTGIEVRHF